MIAIDSMQSARVIHPALFDAGQHFGAPAGAASLTAWCGINTLKKNVGGIMFRDALSIASKFTFPLVMSRQNNQGFCSSGIGTYVVVNDEGWIVTAGHNLRLWKELSSEVASVRDFDTNRQAIEDDQSIDRSERKRRLKALGQPSPTANKRCSAWWGMPGPVELVDFVYPEPSTPEFGDLIDIGVGKLQGFNPDWVSRYPIFKDPTKNFEPGEYLCKLGFPFHQFTPTFDDVSGNFRLPAGALPLPRFPMEGMYTRSTEVLIDFRDALGNRINSSFKHPVRYIETSTPGLKGQSGGPTFDIHGTVWAIQAKTTHYHLGFDPTVPGRPTQKEHQFLNVGLGVHAATILGVFSDFQIKHQISEY